MRTWVFGEYFKSLERLELLIGGKIDELRDAPEN
jgi:hypothetical protein